MKENRKEMRKCIDLLKMSHIGKVAKIKYQPLRDLQPDLNSKIYEKEQYNVSIIKRVE